ncbi:MAG: Shedu anti-phage system protein SduA domain-containing protein [Phycisphaerales bacterium]
MIRQKVKELAEAIATLSDGDLARVFRDAEIDELFGALLPKPYDKSMSIYDYLLANKTRMTLAAGIRHAITMNCSVKGRVEGAECYLSPSHFQWFPEGIVFLQGKERFAGLIERYLAGKIEVAVAARTVRGGESMGVNDFMFIDIEQARKQVAAERVPNTVTGLEQVFAELQNLLAERVEDEAVYQKFFTRNGWFFGLQFSRIDSHKAFNDENIPDFTGVRMPRGNRDIIEIKHPFLTLFGRDGGFRKEFHDAWSQGERYLTFADRETDYLRRQKSLVFENPHCFIIAGESFDEGQASRIRDKEHMNPRITMMSYNEVMRLGRHTIDVLKGLLDKSEGQPGEDARQ